MGESAAADGKSTAADATRKDAGWPAAESDAARRCWRSPSWARSSHIECCLTWARPEIGLWKRLRGVVVALAPSFMWLHAHTSATQSSACSASKGLVTDLQDLMGIFKKPQRPIFPIKLNSDI